MSLLLRAVFVYIPRVFFPSPSDRVVFSSVVPSKEVEQLVQIEYERREDYTFFFESWGGGGKKKKRVHSV